MGSRQNRSESLPLSNSYSQSYTGSGVDIYVLDTGVDFTHRDFLSSYSTFSRTSENIYNGYGPLARILTVIPMVLIVPRLPEAPSMGCLQGLISTA